MCRMNSLSPRRVVLWTKTRILWGAKCPKRPKIVKKPQNFKHFSIFISIFMGWKSCVQKTAELRPWSRTLWRMMISIAVLPVRSALPIWKSGFSGQKTLTPCNPGKLFVSLMVLQTVSYSVFVKLCRKLTLNLFIFFERAVWWVRCIDWMSEQWDSP